MSAGPPGLLFRAYPEVISIGEEKTPSGIDRRQFLRRAAAAGAVGAWSAPIIQTITSTPAFAQGASGTPKDLSYIAVWYTCLDSPGETCAVKWNLDGGGAEVGDFFLPLCGDTRSGGTCGDPSHFILSGQGQQFTVCLSDAGVAAGCSISSGIGKCGNDPETGCVSGVGDSGCLTFSGCGVSDAQIVPHHTGPGDHGGNNGQGSDQVPPTGPTGTTGASGPSGSTGATGPTT